MIRTKDEYLNSLRGRSLKIWLNGKTVDEPVDHPLIRPSMNALAETYVLAEEEPELGMVYSPLAEAEINRFLHVCMTKEDLLMQNRMQRRLGQRTGTCFQRCVGMDALNALWSVTWDTDEAHKTRYHENLRAFIRDRQLAGEVIGGAMTDPKGDRSRPPHLQDDPDLYTRVVERRPDGVVVRGAKMHQTGTINSHWMIIMPTIRMTEKDKDYAISGAIPVDAPGITYIYGRQNSDGRLAEEGAGDCGNALYGGQESVVIFDDVFIPNELIFMNGEVEAAAPLVDRFTGFHRRSYICKAGVGDVMIGVSTLAAESNGVQKASHIRDKVVEMGFLNETIAGTALAACHEAEQLPAGNWQPDAMMSNICKHHVTRVPYEISKMAQDIAGGLMVTLPSWHDFDNPETGELLRKFIRAVGDPEERRRIMRLMECMTIGRNAVSYLSESMHGAGSPQAQRVLIARLLNLDKKKKLAKRLAGIDE